MTELNRAEYPSWINAFSVEAKKLFDANIYNAEIYKEEISKRDRWLNDSVRREAALCTEITKLKGIITDLNKECSEDKKSIKRIGKVMYNIITLERGGIYALSAMLLYLLATMGVLSIVMLILKATGLY